MALSANGKMKENYILRTNVENVINIYIASVRYMYPGMEIHIDTDEYPLV
jgi:hypothetical protein